MKNLSALVELVSPSSSGLLRNEGQTDQRTHAQRQRGRGFDKIHLDKYNLPVQHTSRPCVVVSPVIFCMRLKRHVSGFLSPVARFCCLIQTATLKGCQHN